MRRQLIVIGKVEVVEDTNSVFSSLVVEKPDLSRLKREMRK